VTRLLAETMAYFPRPHDPLSEPRLAEVDHLDVQTKLDGLGLGTEEYHANEAAWVGHFNGPLDEGAFTSALRWTAATAGSWHLMHEASSVFRLKGGTKALVDAIASDTSADIRTNTEVLRIEHGEQGAEYTSPEARSSRPGGSCSPCPRTSSATWTSCRP
jgi:phytoene dehydrogenase-like protein